MGRQRARTLREAFGPVFGGRGALHHLLPLPAILFPIFNPRGCLGHHALPCVNLGYCPLIAGLLPAHAYVTRQLWHWSLHPLCLHPLRRSREEAMAQRRVKSHPGAPGPTPDVLGWVG